MTLSSNNDFLYLGSWDNSIMKFDLITQKVKLLGKHKKEVFTIVLTSDDKYLYSGGYDNIIMKWDTTKE